MKPNSIEIYTYANQFLLVLARVKTCLRSEALHNYQEIQSARPPK